MRSKIFPYGMFFSYGLFQYYSVPDGGHFVQLRHVHVPFLPHWLL